MIRCYNHVCKNEWFHYECVNLKADMIPEAVWVCEFCNASKTKSKKRKRKWKWTNHEVE